jgi:hypothetical protein
MAEGGLPLIIRRAVGHGSVLLIGDSYFLGNDNLETMTYARQGNLLFLRRCSTPCVAVRLEWLGGAP